MKATEYCIKTQDDAASFEKLLDQYCIEHNNIIRWPLMKLGDAYSVLKRNGRDSRCFSAYLDLYLQNIALQKDVTIIVEEINREYQSGTDEGFFAERMNRYIAASNTAHRIRAMWDKLMGFTVLLHWSDRYDEFCKSNSRIKAYGKIAESWIITHGISLSPDSEQWNSSWSEEICKIKDCVEFISNNFRTAEAHYVGRLWKWAFAIQRDEDDPFVELIKAANDLGDHFRKISTIISLSDAYTR